MTREVDRADDSAQRSEPTVRPRLAAALTMLELLLGREANAEEQLLLDRSLAAGKDLHHAINNLIDAGAVLRPRGEVFVPRDLIDEVAASTRRRFVCAVDMVVLCAEELGRPVKGDAGLLRRILHNLLDNALRYNEEGGEVLVSVSAIDEGESRRIRFDITDTGRGMSRRNLDELRQDGEAGLGLRCVERLVAALDGRFGLDGQEGDGTTVWVELPFTITAGAGDTWSFAGTEVLIVDSSGGVRMALEFELDRLGCRFASHAALAEVDLAFENARVVFSDARMVGDARSLAALDPDLRQALVAVCRDADERQAMGALGLPVLELPVSRRALAEVLEAMLAGNASV